MPIGRNTVADLRGFLTHLRKSDETIPDYHSDAGDVLANAYLAVDRNMIQKSGTWFSYGEERIGQGRENARLWLKEHPDATVELEGKLREALGLTRPAQDGDQPAAATPEARGERRVRI